MITFLEPSWFAGVTIKNLKYLSQIVIVLLMLNSKAFSQNDSITTKLSFDLGITRGQNINLWPVFKKQKSSERKELQILFPFYANRTDFIKRKKHLRVLPFYIRDSSSKGIDQRFFSFYYPSLLTLHKDSVSGRTSSFKLFELAPHISLLGLSKTAQGLNIENNMFFFIWYKINLLEQKTRFVVFPIYWYAANKLDTTKLLFPLFYNKKTNYDNHFNIAFLFDRKVSSTRVSNTLFPLWWNRTDYDGQDTFKKNIVFPIYWHSESKQAKSTVLFPLFFNFHNAHNHSFTFFPIFSTGERTDKSFQYLAITPFYWKLKGEKAHTEFLFPIYWNTIQFQGPDTIRHRVIFPVYWSSSKKNKSKKTIFPFLFKFQNPYHHSFTLFPFYTYGSRPLRNSKYFAITPLFWHVKKHQDTRNILFPLFWNKTEIGYSDTLHRNVLFPLLFVTRSASENNTVLFPFYFEYKNKYRYSKTIFPFYSRSENYDRSRKVTGISPFYWRWQTNTGFAHLVFPIFFRQQKNLQYDTLKTTVIFPIYWSYKTKVKQNTVLFPFVFSIKNTKRKLLTVFPLFSVGHKLDSSSRHFAVTPLFWHVEKRKSLSNVLFPIYWNFTRYYKNDTVHREILFPIVWTNKSKYEENVVFFPVLFKFKNTFRTTLTVLPLFSYGEKKDTKSSHLVITPFYWQLKNHYKDQYTLFPFYWRVQTHWRGDTITQTVLFPVYWALKSKLKNYRILFPLLFETKNNGGRSLTLFPLFSSGRDSSGNKKHLVITPLFWQLKSKEKITTVLFPFYWNIKKLNENDSVKRHIIFPFLWSSRSGNKSSLYILPFIYKNRTAVYSSFTFFPLFSFGKSPDHRKKHLMITPLFGQFTNGKTTKRLLFPLFTSRSSENENRFSLLFFLLRQTKNKEYTRLSFLWPICEYYRSTNKKSFRFAPFIWYTKSDSSRLFSIQPLFYSYKNTTRNTFILSFFLYKHERVPGISILNSFLWRAYYSKKYMNGDFEHRFLHLVYANVKTADYREKSLFPLFHSIKKQNGDRSFSAAFGFYNRFKEFKPEINDYYEEENIFWFVRLRSNYKKLQAEGKNAFIRKKKKR